MINDKKIQSIIQSNITVAEIDPEMRLDELNTDSITFIKIIVALETEFDFEFEDEKLLFSAFSTIQSMIDYVNEQVGGSNVN